MICRHRQGSISKRFDAMAESSEPKDDLGLVADDQLTMIGPHDSLPTFDDLATLLS